MEIEEIVPVESFPGYEITSFGRVYNAETGREMALSPTQNGEMTVGFMHGGRQYRRSVKVLVAKAFVDGEDDIFNTPILLDGNRRNLRASNIVWRPRWFAWKYVQQFDDPSRRHFNNTVVDADNFIQYDSVFEAATTNGLLFMDIWYSILNDTPVFPTGQRFYYPDLS